MCIRDSKSRLRFEKVDFNALLKQTLVSLEPQLQGKDLTVNSLLHGDQEGHCFVTADEAAVVRIVTNLMINAIRFTPQGGKIQIESRKQIGGSVLTIVISDSGPGIAAEDQRHIFEQFYKADKSRQSEGSGLGLYIARNLLLAHGQPIEVGRSTLGGAKFTFSLELA